ncbi:hypothetical protein GDO78_019756 [Eleutherodactylus coqui]|uniref:Fibronectin type-III domain-containing protein n=1 Tax=Eleutherodactylus coqui TaxID=57060 RepID=A0A8J6C6B9_ELECQ|nr:hypothetical protein GDO78_019756 [Eleutherodactylus coqui]
MVGTAGCCSALIIVLCCGPFRTSRAAGTICPKPAVPEDAILVTLHSAVNRTCAGCEGRGSWSRHNPHGNLRSLADGSHLVLSSVTYEDEDNYTCYKDGAAVCSVELMVKDEQQDGSKLFCYHRHPTHNITCHWKPSRQLHPSARATLVGVRLPVPTFYPCTYDSSSEKFTCSVLYSEGSSGRQLFYLCVSSRTTSQLTASLEADAKDLLHVGPPLNVCVAPVENNRRRLRVSWSRPEFWDGLFYHLKYQVLYQVEGSPHASNRTTKEMAFIIPDAVMGRKHLIRVRASEEYQENWGSWSEVAMGVPWSDEAKATLVPSEYDPPISQEETDPPKNNEVLKIPRIIWIGPCVAIGLVIFFLLGLWIRHQEIKVQKLKWGFLHTLFHPSSKVDTMQAPASESPLMSSPLSMALTIPPRLDGE